MRGSGPAVDRPALSPEALYASPNALAPFYRRFRVEERLLLSGHSHQAWPDCGFEGQRQAWLDAAELVDEKWERAFARADRVRAGYTRLLGDRDGVLALGESTHHLVLPWLSALPLRERPRLVTTDGEFHSLRRQLERLAEAGLEVVRVPAHPAATVGERLAETVDARTSAVMVSSVFYATAHLAGGLERVARACRRQGAQLLIDAYHSLNVVPFSMKGFEDAYVTGGGYKYCQLGEGNAFLRLPADCRLRPVVTGWFSEFSALTDAARAGVAYGEGPARFAGATYDPTSHYRASEVFDFFEEMGLTADFLREVSRHQVGLLASAFDDLDLDPATADRDRSVPLEGIGGFLALRSPRAGDLHRALRERGIFTDFRGDTLRMGPAPYLSDRQLLDAMAALSEVAHSLSG
ncbi:MAG: kynureninase [Gemmatimonadota bacterium]